MENANWLLVATFSVIGSVLLSIGSNLLTPYTERLFGTLASSMKHKSRKKRLEMRNRILTLVNNRTRRSHLRANGTHIMYLAIWSLMFAIFISVTAAAPFSPGSNLVRTGFSLLATLLVLLGSILFGISLGFLNRCGKADDFQNEIFDREEELGRPLKGEEREQFLAKLDQKHFGVSTEDLEWERQQAAAVNAESEKRELKQV